MSAGVRSPVVLALFCALATLTSLAAEIRHRGGRGGRPRVLWAGESPEAMAANNSAANVTAQMGASAYLNCTIAHFAERGVSWIRKRDWHILSSGTYTYTNDERFQILHGESSDEWTLQIKFVQKRDNGTYECQVPTRTGILSHYVHLDVVVPEAFILGSGEHHLDLGSVIQLICVVDKSPIPPQYVFWYHNSKMINYEGRRAGVTVQTEPGARTQSRLTIHGATLKDSGNYTCSASNTHPASIQVFVSEGSNKMAAILRRNTSAIHDFTSSTTLLLLALNVLITLLGR